MSNILHTKAGYPDAEPKPISELMAENTLDFDQIYRENSSYVYNTCVGILGDSEDARDAAQDTFVQLYKSFSKLRGECTYRTWLYRVAVNKCMDILRHRKKHFRVESLEYIHHNEGPLVDISLLEERVRQAILTLKPQFRAVLVLYYFQQLSYAEIAESLNCSLVQVRTRLHRARKAFRMAFCDGGDGIEM